MTLSDFLKQAGLRLKPALDAANRSYLRKSLLGIRAGTATVAQQQAALRARDALKAGGQAGLNRHITGSGAPIAPPPARVPTNPAQAGATAAVAPNLPSEQI